MAKRARFYVEQIIRILREYETSGLPVSSFLRRYGIGRETFYRWRRTYGGLSEPEARRLKRLERENQRLKVLIAERELELEALREVTRKKSTARGPGGH
jgi:putative transposase